MRRVPLFENSHSSGVYQLTMKTEFYKGVGGPPS